MKNLILKTLLLILLALLGHNYFYAQSYKIIYEMRWKPTKNSEEYNKELCALILNGSEPSFFEGYNNFRRDSLKTKIINDYEASQSKGSLRIPSGEKNAMFRPLIIKNTKDKRITVEEAFYAKTFAVPYSCSQNWKIQNNEKATIFGYKVQKATTQFGGRKWIAWFTTDIPIQDGPYKFYGLPGLILKISDSSENYLFEIKGITKEVNDLSSRNFGNGKPIELTPAKWNIFWEKYKKQPSMILENLNTAQTTYVINGKDVNSREVKEEYDRKEWEAMKKFENPIELTHSCK